MIFLFTDFYDKIQLYSYSANNNNKLRTKKFTNLRLQYLLPIFGSLKDYSVLLSEQNWNFKTFGYRLLLSQSEQHGQKEGWLHYLILNVTDGV